MDILKKSINTLLTTGLLGEFVSFSVNYLDEVIELLPSLEILFGSLKVNNKLIIWGTKGLQIFYTIALFLYFYVYEGIGFKTSSFKKVMMIALIKMIILVLSMVLYFTNKDKDKK